MFLTPLISAPVDIMIMLLGAFLIGYGIAWLLRSQTIKSSKAYVDKLKQEVRKVNIANENLDIAKDKLQDQLNECVENLTGRFDVDELQQATIELKKERERSETARASLTEIESAHEALKQELQQRFDQMLSQEEANKLRSEINRLRVFNATLEDELKELKEQKEQSKSEPASSEASDLADADLSFISSIGIKSASYHERDDLKRISGVGPFIEEKLHKLGIYTFQQIANMTHEQAEKINEAIEFFPGRIQRDGWILQASNLVQSEG